MSEFPKPRVQFLAIKNYTIKKLEKGYDNKSIYTELSKSKKIIMSYNTFNSYVNKYCKLDNSNKEVDIKNNNKLLSETSNTNKNFESKINNEKRPPNLIGKQVIPFGQKDKSISNI